MAACIVIQAAKVHRFNIYQNIKTMNLLTSDKIKQFFPDHTVPCVKNFVLLMNLIIQCRTVSLYKCRDKVQQYSKGTKNQSSCYSRLIRFFKMKKVEEFVTGIRSLILTMTTVDLQYLILDRSNWKRGTKNINLLTLGNLCNGIFLPLHWIQLNKRGNSNLEDRKTVVEELIKLLDKFGKIVRGSILLADREFIGQEWFEYLLSEQLSFVIRLREKMYFDLQTHTGKKNFAQVVTQTCREMGNLRCAYVFGRPHVYFCNH
jgi:hypothetical protein